MTEWPGDWHHITCICIYTTEGVLESVGRKRFEEGDRINLRTPGALNSTALSVTIEQLYYTKVRNYVHR